MAYPKKLRLEVVALAQSGEPVLKLAEKYKINPTTIYDWLKKAKNQSIEESIKNLEERIAELSKKKQTQKVSLQIAMLTSSLKKLKKIHNTEKPKPKKKKPSVKLTKLSRDLKSKMLDESYGLYSYQKKFIEDESRFRIWLKARQIGATYVCAGECLIEACGGMDQLIISASEHQALKWYEEIYKHAEKLGITLSGSENKIKTPGGIIYIFAHNFRTIQGFSGSVWMDEFAWYPNPQKIWLAFVPSITSKKVEKSVARLTILSTPFEQESLFYDLVHNEEKYYMFSRHYTDIYQAKQGGLDVDIELLRDLFDAESFASAYECQFIDDEESFFPVSLIKSCVHDYFYYTPDKNSILYAGYDIGRKRDLSVLAVMDKTEDFYTLAVLERLSRATFNEQKTFLENHLKFFKYSHLNIDKTGIGMNLAEDMARKYPARVTGVYFTPTQKEIMVLNLKKMFEDKMIRIPNDQNLIRSIHAIRRKPGQKRMLYDADRNSFGHADEFWALALACKDIPAMPKRGKRGRAWII